MIFFWNRDLLISITVGTIGGQQEGSQYGRAGSTWQNRYKDDSPGVQVSCSSWSTGVVPSMNSSLAFCFLAKLWYKASKAFLKTETRTVRHYTETPLSVRDYSIPSGTAPFRPGLLYSVRDYSIPSGTASFRSLYCTPWAWGLQYSTSYYK